MAITILPRMRVQRNWSAGDAGDQWLRLGGPRAGAVTCCACAGKSRMEIARCRQVARMPARMACASAPPVVRLQPFVLRVITAGRSVENRSYRLKAVRLVAVDPFLVGVAGVWRAGRWRGKRGCGHRR